MLDVGSGGGRASMALVPPASMLVAVDHQQGMLDAFTDAALRRGVRSQVHLGDWPAVADDVPECDVVVCHHVAYNVADLGPFLVALDAHARHRVVLEVPEHHPLSNMNPLWKQFWDLDRPTRPTAEDVAAIARALGFDAHLDLWQDETWGRRVTPARRRAGALRADPPVPDAGPRRRGRCRADRAVGRPPAGRGDHLVGCGLVTYDVDRIRARIPALADGTAYFDGPGGTQTPDVVAAAIAGALMAGLSNRGSTTQAERNADGITVGARLAGADLVNGDPAGIVFGRSMTELTFQVARTLAQQWGPGDEVVVTRLDHDGNVRPWVTYAERTGATVRWAEFEPEHRHPHGRGRPVARQRQHAGRRGHGGVQHPRHPARRRRHRRRPRRHRRALLRRRRPPHRARPHRHGGHRRRLLRVQPVQVPRPAHRHAGGVAGAAGDHASGQAASQHRAGPRAVRARHAALRAPRRGHRRHRRAGRPRAG